MDIFKVKTLNTFFSVSQKHELTGSCMEPFKCGINYFLEGILGYGITRKNRYVYIIGNIFVNTLAILKILAPKCNVFIV